VITHTHGFCSPQSLQPFSTIVTRPHKRFISIRLCYLLLNLIKDQGTAMSRSVFVLFMETDRTPAIPFLYHSIILFPLSLPPPPSKTLSFQSLICSYQSRSSVYLCDSSTIWFEKKRTKRPAFLAPFYPQFKRANKTSW